MDNAQAGCQVTLLEPLASGGLSDVYKGFDTKTDRVVAVKILKDLGDGLTKAFWKKEIESLTRLKHRNIINLVGSCEKQEGSSTQYWIVLERLEESLSQRYARGTYRFNSGAWLGYAYGLIHGLAHAHERNVAHRDIKPDNLLFRKRDDEDRSIVIADFGISKSVDGDTDTQTVADFGSLIFSAPDHSTRNHFARDVYSAAAVLVQLTSNVLVKDTLELYKALEVAALPAPFKKLLEVSLDLDPDNRPNNMVDFKARFESLLEAEKRKQPPIDISTLSIPVKFTTGSKSSLVSESMPDFARAKSKLDSILRSGDLFANFLPNKSENDEDNAPVISICAQNWVFTLKQSKDRDSSPFLLMIGASQPDVDVIEHYKFGAKNVGRKYSLQALDERQPVPAGRGLEAILSELERFAPQGSSVDTTLSSYDSWSKVLEAREKLILSAFEPLVFQSVRLERDLVIFGLNSEIEGELLDSSWEIKDVKGVSFTVVGVDGTNLWTTPSKSVGTISQKGLLEPALGRGGASLRRQKEAVQSFKSGDASERAVAIAIANPSDALSMGIQNPITPVMPNLDDDKSEAVSAALASDDLFVVQGPPGTGKTNFIAELVHQIKLRDPDSKILLVAQTHVAVDNALLRLEKTGYTDMLRIGRLNDPKLHPEAEKYVVERKIKEWIEGISNQARLDLRKRAGIQGEGIERLEALSILSELNSIRKQAAYLENKFTLTTTATAFEASVDTDELAKVEDAISGNDLRREGLRNKLVALSPAIASQEAEWTDLELDNRVREIASKFEDSDQLLKLLDVQNGWLIKIHTDDDLRSKFLGSAGLVSGTCVGFLGERAIRDMEFDYCIVDEASKATATETLVSLAKSKRAILVGDDAQLPPHDEDLLEHPDIMASFNVTEADIKRTLFDVLKAELPEAKKARLQTQYRMSKPIGDLISTCFYEGNLISVNESVIDGYANLVGKQVRWLDTSEHPKRAEYESRNGGFTNPVEARAIANEVEKIAKLVMSRHLKVDPEKFELLVVSPYAAQKRVIESELSIRNVNNINWRVLTADSVQGSEADIVLVATTRSNARKSLGFLRQAQWRRINVALSRAKFGLIVVGDASFIKATPGGLSRALDYIIANPLTCSVEKVASNV
jgi:serine/threonine protein kinase